MKKTIVLISLVLFILSGCTKSQENFTATILEVNENSLLVKVDEDQDEVKSSDTISVSLNDKTIGYDIEFKPDDHIRIHYDGVILESYPAQITTVSEVELID